jgi:hypothetical protein
MTVAEIKKWVWEHVFQILITALVSLVTIIGTYLLATIKGELDSLQCRVSQYAAANEFRSVQLKLVMVPLEDARRDSESYNSLASVISGYEVPLNLCDKGKKVLSDIVAYRSGLDSFIDRDWTTALKKFQSISTRTALSEKSIATVLVHQYLQYKEQNNPEAPHLEEQMRARLASAYDLASKESDYSAKETAIAYMRCDQMLLDKDVDRAVSCLDDLVTSGFGNYAVHYNIAALSARQGKFDRALTEMGLCMKLPGAYNQRRSDIEADIDFKRLLSDASYGPKFEKLIEKLPP